MTTFPPPSEYKEPNENAAPLGFASSIINGSTVEGGLRSLTYKSIYAAQLTNELDMAKQAIIGDNSGLTKITEKPLVDGSRVATLQAEITNIKSASTQRNTEADEQISQANQKLEQELSAKSISDTYTAQVRNLGELPPRSSRYQIKSVSGLAAVEKMEDVQGFDASIYQRAAERRREEEERLKLEKQQEEERKRLEQEREKERSQQELQQQELQQQQQLQQQEMQQQALQQHFPDSFGHEMQQDSMMLDAPQLYQAPTGYGIEESEISDTPMHTDYSVDHSALGSANFTPISQLDPHGSPDVYQ